MANHGNGTLDLRELHISRTPTSRPNQRAHSPIDQDARDAALRAELAGVQQINKVIEGVIGSLEKAKANMETVSSTVNSANTLLNLWVRILSQTEHTQRLLLSGHWEGGNKDLNEIEQEALAKAQEMVRRKDEERARAAAKEREREKAAAAREAVDSGPSSLPGRGLSSGYGRVRGKVGAGAGGNSSATGSGRVPVSSSLPSDAPRGRGIPPRGLRKGGGRLGSGVGRGTAGRGVK